MTEKEKQVLPEGWRWAKLNEICYPDKVLIQPDSETAFRLPYLSLEHIESETGKILKEPQDKPEDEGKSTTFRFDGRHVLYSKLRPYLNKVAMPDFEGRCTTELLPILPMDGISREFLAFALRRKEIVDAAMRGNTGSRMPRANMEELFREEIPLPPLSEHKRIAIILSEQLAAVEQARKASETQFEAVDALYSSYLREILDSDEAKDWRLVELKQVCQINPRRARELDRSDEVDTRFIPMAAVDDVTGKIAEEIYRPFGEIKKGYTYFEEGDVLFAKITPCMENGKHAVARGLAGGFGFGTTEFHVLRPAPLLHAEWLHFYLRRPEILRELASHASGAVGQQRIQPDVLADLEIPLPPLPEQKRIAASLSKKLAAVDKLRCSCKEQLSAINALPAALLRSAFFDQ